MRITNFTPKPAWVEARIDTKIAAIPASGATGATTIAGITGLQAALDGKQIAGSYAAATHNHIIADVTGLQIALDAKQAAGSFADASHVHTIANVTGLQAALDAKAAATSVPNASYRSLLDCTASHTAARAAGTYWFGQGNPAGITGVGTLYAPNLIYIDAADYPTLNGVAPKLRIRAQIYVNDVAPTGNYTIGLYPVTRPATSGAAGLAIFTMGAVVAGSAPAALVAPAADSANVLVGADFALPATGHYVLGMVTTAAVAASSHLHISAILQMRNA